MYAVSKSSGSISSQTYRNIEIIVVDDGSTDRTVEVVHSWRSAQSQPLRDQVIVVPLPRNVGSPGSTTIGLYLTRGEFIAMQDSDDLSHPERFEKQIHYLRNHPEIEMVGTKFATFEDGDFQNQNDTWADNWLRYDEQSIRETYAKGHHCVSHGTTLYRGTLFDRFGGHIRAFRNDLADWDFIRRIANHGARIQNIREVLYYIRLHPSQQSRLAEGGLPWDPDWTW
jgi:glycosyltransferase involved in cell wall biosynthesis